MNFHYQSATFSSFRYHHIKTEHSNDTDPMIDSKWTINVKPDLSDISPVFEGDDIFIFWMVIWIFIIVKKRSDQSYTIYGVKEKIRFSSKYWSWVIDRLLVSHGFGIIRYLAFMQVIKGFCKSYSTRHFQCIPQP